MEWLLLLKEWWQQYDHVCLSLFALWLAWGDLKLRKLAGCYLAVVLACMLIEPTYVGRAWYLLMVSAELLIVAGCIWSKHRAAKFVATASAINISVNLLTGARYIWPEMSFMKVHYPGWIQLGEYAGVLCIIIFSPLIWDRLSGWYDRRQARKTYRWLAKVLTQARHSGL